MIKSTKILIAPLLDRLILRAKDIKDVSELNLPSIEHAKKKKEEEEA